MVCQKDNVLNKTDLGIRNSARLFDMRKYLLVGITLIFKERVLALV